MDSIDVKEILNLTPRLLSIPFKRVWYSYDEEADVLYLNFKKPSHADDTELTDDDIIIRYEKGEVVGITVPACEQKKKRDVAREGTAYKWKRDGGFVLVVSLSNLYHLKLGVKVNYSCMNELGEIKYI